MRRLGMFLALSLAALAAGCADELGPAPEYRDPKAQSDSLIEGDRITIVPNSDSRAAKMQRFKVQGPGETLTRTLYFEPQTAGQFSMLNGGYVFGTGCEGQGKLKWELEFRLWDPAAQDYTREPQWAAHFGDGLPPWYDFRMNAGERLRMSFTFINPRKCRELQVNFLPTFR